MERLHPVSPGDGEGRRNKVDVPQDGVWVVRTDKMRPSVFRLLFRPPEERLHDDGARHARVGNEY